MSKRKGFEKLEEGIEKLFSRKSDSKKAGHSDYEFESIDRVKVHSLATKSLSAKAKTWQLKRRAATYWLLTLGIGIAVGICAYLSHEGLAGVQGFRIWLSRLFMQWFTGPGGVFIGWTIYSLSSVAVVLIGGLLCIYVQPSARGSGIAEIKAFLNGVNIMFLFQLRTLFIKLIAVICAVGGGLAVGQEGPMIHIGAMVAWNMSQMKFSSISSISNAFRKFQNDRDKRDFVTTGAAMGVSAAFSAPIGGTLFGIEEASSFWSHALIWRSFFGCMVATWTANFLIGGSKLGLWGLIDQPSHVMYRVPFGHGYRLYEIFPFMLVGILGGILGALFIKLNVVINKYRKKTYYSTNRNKVIELAVVAFVTSSLSILLPMAFSCQDSSLAKPPASSDSESTGTTINAEAEEALVFEIYNCGHGRYNPLASLWFTSAEMTLKHLFVRSAPLALPYAPLLTYFLLFYTLACFTAGTWIAAGLLVPMLIMGASYGRLFGVILSSIFPYADLDPGVYALLGATAFMGGVTRMTISLVVIMIEITNDLDALLPIMLVAMIAKWVGDSFGHSLYDEQLHIGNVPFLEWDPPRVSAVMVCKEAARSDIPIIEQLETVENLVKIVQDHDAPSTLPVIDHGVLKGSIPKFHLKVLLAQRVWDKSNDFVDVLAIRKFKEEPNFDFDPIDMQKFVDLSPYVNMATFMLQENFPLNLAYKIFRSQGLRQLFIVNYKNQFVGMIERENFLLHDQRYHQSHHKGKHEKPPETKSLMKANSEPDMVKLEEQTTSKDMIPLEIREDSSTTTSLTQEDDSQKQ